MKLMNPAPIIALLTDFGSIDPFVGIMKGVISQIAPDTSIVDISHEVPSGDINRAAIMLWQATPYFPEGTIFLSVVDPGVGTTRRGIILKTEDKIYVGPDNGLFTFILDKSSQAWELSDSKFQLSQSSTTFHGRDVFSPAAAYAARGIDASEFGNFVTNIIHLPDPHFQIVENQLEGEILYIDKFGNLLTSIGRFIILDQVRFRLDPWLEETPEFSENITVRSKYSSLILPNGSQLSWVTTFEEISEDECGFMVGSSGLLEIAANRKSAADVLGLSLGDRVTLKF